MFAFQEVEKRDIDEAEDLKSLVDSVEKSSRKLVDNGKEFIPIFCLQSSINKKQFRIKGLFKDEFEKEMMFKFLLFIVEQEKIDSYVFCQEAHMKVVKDMDEYKGAGSLANDPASLDIALFGGATKCGEKISRIYDMAYSSVGNSIKETMNPELSKGDANFSGRFLELFELKLGAKH